MESRSSLSGGFLDSLRGLGDSLLGSVQERLELFSIELHEEKLRLLQSLLWAGAVMFAGMMALTFASILAVYLFWETARVGVLAGLAGFYTVAAVSLVLAFRRRLARQPRPFAGTLRELEEDRACMHNGN